MSTHRHKCPRPRCGTVWEHGDDCGGKSLAHECPVCRTEEWNKYRGDDEPTHLRTSCAKGDAYTPKRPGIKLPQALLDLKAENPRPPMAERQHRSENYSLVDLLRMLLDT